jgi:hypothetical protein
MMNEDAKPYQTRKWVLLKHFNIVDGLTILGFALFSVIYFLGRWKGAYPFIFLGGDAANIASFAAAWDHPKLFLGDQALGNPSNFRFYATIHIPILQALFRITRDYGSAFISLLAPHIFIQTLGFYLFGRLVFQSRYWAILLAIVTLAPVWLNLGEYWGISPDPQPRFSFQALLPYILAATFYWGQQPSSWPWLMAATGSLIYVHPVSTPGWGLAIWLGFLALKPVYYSFKKQLAYMLMAGVVFLAVALPWLIHYLSNHAHGATANYKEIYELMITYFGKGYLDIPWAIKEFILLMWQKGLLPFFTVSLPLILWLRREDRQTVLLVSLWLVGILITAIAIPMTEQVIARAYNLIPVQIDLVRGLRYVVPILLLLCLWSLVEIAKKYGNTRIIAVIGALLVILWAYQPKPDFVRTGLIFSELLQCWRQGNLVCMNVADSRSLEALEAISRLTPPTSRILPLGEIAQAYSLAIRYYALRPVVYSYKDVGVLGYANHAEFIKWHQKNHKMKKIEKEKNSQIQLQEVKKLSQELGAQYCLVDNNLSLMTNSNLKGENLIYKNQALSLIKIIN